MLKGYLKMLFGIFLLLAVLSLLISDAPPRVHAMNIAAFCLSFVVPGLLAVKYRPAIQAGIWLAGGVLGLFVWDIGISFVIVKHDPFMGWYLVYPLGLIGLLCLQLAAKYISRWYG